MLTSLTDSTTIQLTRGKHSCTQPRWAPDGKLVAFLSSRPAPQGKSSRAEDDEDDGEDKDSKVGGKTQIWLINPFGGEPWDVPTHHGWLQFRTLQQLGKTEVRFLLFPGEKHSLTKLGHQKRKIEEELAWFDRHLFKTAQPTNVAYKAASPLAQALALQKALKHGRLYGVSEKDILVPETVPYEKLHVGRFEVTRAQFARFDKAYAIEPGTENHPANGITLEQAKAYCSWLSKATGRTYRLGTVAELKELYDSSEEAENTLDYWAGYAVNPEDRVRLKDKIKELPGKAPLLKEVGSFKSAGANTPIFDLGGNVAEWVLDAKGNGTVLGGSADAPADDRTRRAAAEYIGFRVVAVLPPTKSPTQK
jgi:hypothetical protein